MSDTDKNYKAWADLVGLVLTDLTVDPREEGLNPADFDDLFKLSHAEQVKVTGLTVRGGGLQKENCIDMNRLCRDVEIINARLEAGQQNAITIKGGCRDIHLSAITIERAGGHCDIELGNWSDQSWDPVTGVVLTNVCRADGKPVRVRVGHADAPVIVGGNVKILFWGSLYLKTYWNLKWATRKFFGGKLKFLMP
ncbi:MAG TPA: hypothetical protein VG838_00500 [Opitutaceae bacterium]|nr:hypothetical protein [Opitutaceae bacterium]